MAQTKLAAALARLKRLDERIAKKQRFVLAFLLRQGNLRDPLEQEGGAAAVLRGELQSIASLGEQKVQIRRAVRAAYDRAEATVARRTQTIRDWLIWRREVAPHQARFLEALRERIEEARRAAAARGAFFVNLDEHDLIRDADGLEETLGALEGQLSLKGATAAADLPPEEEGRTAIEESIDRFLKGAEAADEPAAAPEGARRVPLPMTASGSMSEEVRRLARDPGNKILAIKLHREQTGLGLKEAKDAVEAFMTSGM